MIYIICKAAHSAQHDSYMLLNGCIVSMQSCTAFVRPNRSMSVRVQSALKCQLEVSQASLLLPSQACLSQLTEGDHMSFANATCFPHCGQKWWVSIATGIKYPMPKVMTHHMACAQPLVSLRFPDNSTVNISVG